MCLIMFFDILTDQLLEATFIDINLKSVCNQSTASSRGLFV